jgi:hypothetical protein
MLDMHHQKKFNKKESNLKELHSLQSTIIKIMPLYSKDYKEINIKYKIKEKYIHI